MDRQQRLLDLKKYLDDNIDKDYNFETIYEKFLSEISEEQICNYDPKQGQYLIELNHTKRSANHYKNSKKKNYFDFKAFIFDFGNDVDKGLEFYSKPISETTIEN
jgi:hypothetical protein